jgi:hypothetical protein
MLAQAIMFTIATGDDGVRSDSDVLASIFWEEGKFSQNFPLHLLNGPDVFSSGSVYISIWPLATPMEMDPGGGPHIDYIQITLNQDGGLFEGTDYWDILGVSVALMSGANLVLAAGNAIINGAATAQAIATQGSFFGVASAVPLAHLGDKSNLAFSGDPGNVNIF